MSKKGEGKLRYLVRETNATSTNETGRIRTAADLRPESCCDDDDLASPETEDGDELGRGDGGGARRGGVAGEEERREGNLGEGRRSGRRR
jgi:hypothetical protein